MSPATDSSGNHISHGARRYALAMLAVVYMFNFIDRQILAILLPSIRAEFQVGDFVLGLLAGTAFALFYVILGVPVARLADRVNRRNLIALAVAIWSGMTALSGLAANIWQLALARIGVGIGEAGCSPPAHAMIADLYPPEQRSAAMGVYTLGISAGVMLAYMAGGWVVQNIGWREAFFVVGLPGLILAALVRFTVREPARGAAELRRDSGQQPSLQDVAIFLLARKSFISMALGAGISSFVGYAIIFNMPSFMVRSLGVDADEIGFSLGPIYGIAGGLGFFLGGYLADCIGVRGHKHALSFIAAATVASAICFGAVFLSVTLAWCLTLLVLPSVFSNFYLAPVLSQTQSLVSLRMRAVASSLVLLIINVIGLLIGPPVTGLVSDLLRASQGEESMRYALLIVSVVLLPIAAFCYWRAGMTIDADLQRAGECD
ncbi:MAG: MFS transporter [Gammaproteobacteria bacterium]|nr:MFS transporter [Gammaproteobacteria bacterium]MDH5302708.1 MFS transporter [Gammaproteobacteria bacterium]MDH5321903.1 MFS transporter [Gammaproteobacteria bacterium]